MTPRKTVLDDYPRAGELARWGGEAKRTFQLIRKHAGAARRNWLKIGEIAAAVVDGAPRGSGILNRWREAYIPDVNKHELSHAIWCYRHPRAVELVRETVSDPTNIHRMWKAQTDEAVQAFLHQRRNDPEELAKETGLSLFEAQDTLARASRAAARRPAARQPEDVIPFGEEWEAPETAATLAPDPWAAIRLAIDQNPGRRRGARTGDAQGRATAGNANAGPHAHRGGRVMRALTIAFMLAGVGLGSLAFERGISPGGDPYLQALTDANALLAYLGFIAPWVGAFGVVGFVVAGLATGAARAYRAWARAGK